MKNNLIYLFFIALYFIGINPSNAQDSLKVFPIRDFQKIIFENHPLVKQAELLPKQAKAEVLSSRGNFDPKYDFDITRKVFQGKTYFNYLDNGLKIPTWIGTDIKAGFERNTGILVNPTNFTPEEGLWYVGLDIPLIRNMVIDERRAILRQAQLGTQIADAEKVKMINKIIYQSYKDYWDWYFYFEKYKNMEYAWQIAKVRYEGICQRVILGDLAPIDSSEASVIYNDRFIEFQKAFNDFQNSTLVVSTYLWTEDLQALEIANMIPENINTSEMLPDSTYTSIINQYNATHPDLIKLRVKAKQLQFDKKLAFNNAMPNILLTAKYLSTPERDFFGDLNINYLQNNYKITITLAQPLFVRKEVGKFRQAKYKILLNEYEYKVQSRQIKNDIESSYNDIETYYQMTKTMESMYEKYKLLYDGEKQRFENGESTLFLVNSRETKMIESKIKVVETKAKLEKAKAMFYYMAGSIPKL